MPSTPSYELTGSPVPAANADRRSAPRVALRTNNRVVGPVSDRLKDREPAPVRRATVRVDWTRWRSAWTVVSEGGPPV